MDKFWERYITSRPAPGTSKGAFDAFAAAHRDPGPRTMAQEPRIRAQSGGSMPEHLTKMEPKIDDNFWINHYRQVIDARLGAMEAVRKRGEPTNPNDAKYLFEQYNKLKKYGGDTIEFDQRIKNLSPSAEEPEFAAQGGRIGQLVRNTVDGSRPGYDGDSNFNRNPSGVNQHTDAQRTFEEIQKAIDDAPPKSVKRKDGTLKKVPVTPKDLYGKGKNYPHKIIARSEYDLHKDKLNIEGTGKPVVEDTKKGNIVKYARNKLQSNPTILAKMAGKEGYHLSHLSLTELDSLKNLGYLPKDINIKQYHSFEKKIVANAKEIYAAQNNKSLSIPERRAEIAKLQKIDRSLRKEFPKYASTKARLKVQANNVELSGLKIGEKLPDPTVAISQTEGTLLKDIKTGSQKEKEILGLSKKSLEAKIQGIEKVFKERRMKLRKGEAGFIATDILKDIKKLGPKGLRLLSSEWVWPEIVIGWLDKKNMIQKGMSPERASSEMWKHVTFGLRDKGETENAILGQLKKLGYSEKDEKAVEHMMRYSKIGKEIEKTEAGIESMEKVYTPFSTEKGAQQLKEKLKNLKKEQESVAGFYFGALGDKDPKYGLEIYDQASKELMRTEWNKSLEGRKKQLDPYAGKIGNWLNKEVFTIDPQTKQAMQEQIDAMSPQELEQFNMERGVGYERVHPQYGAAMSGKQMEPLRDQIGYMYAGGGMVGIRKPNAIPPERQGLRSIMIGDMDD